MQAAPFLKELLKAYFVCASMILGSIRRSHHTEQQRLKVKVPTCKRFVHSVLKMMAADIEDDIPHYLTQTEDGEFKLSKRHIMKGPAAEKTKSFKLGSNILRTSKPTFADEDDEDDTGVVVEEDEDF
eukprot:jgi/Mesvir1/6648/Mv16299-RA.1